jgi:hypothetical protein
VTLNIKVSWKANPTGYGLGEILKCSLSSQGCSTCGEKERQEAEGKLGHGEKALSGVLP